MYNLFLFGIHQPSQTHKKTPDYVALRSTVLQIRLSFFLCLHSLRPKISSFIGLIIITTSTNQVKITRISSIYSIIHR